MAEQIGVTPVAEGAQSAALHRVLRRVRRRYRRLRRFCPDIHIRRESDSNPYDLVIPSAGKGHPVLSGIEQHRACGKTAVFPVVRLRMQDNSVQRPRVQIRARCMRNIPAGMTWLRIRAAEIKAVAAASFNIVPAVADVISWHFQNSVPSFQLFS